MNHAHTSAFLQLYFVLLEYFLFTDVLFYILDNCYLRIENAEGYVLIAAAYLFVCVLFA